VTAAAVGSLRVGCVKYLNARPLIHGWSGAVVFDHPAALCAQLEADELDVALVSSFELFRQSACAIVDGVAIASDGPVYSVIVASAGELGEVRQIELDPASVTSVNLLRCLLSERGLSIPFTTQSMPVDSPITQGTGRLMIGDQAIRFRQAKETRYRMTDLGELWQASVGLPFVYALWLIRPDCNSAAEIADELRRLRDQNVKRLDELAAPEQEFPPAFCTHYWREHLKFGFGDREKAGLLTFRSLCEKHGILPRKSAPLRLV
jgi:predicted solute-binding protein